MKTRLLLATLALIAFTACNGGRPETLKTSPNGYTASVLLDVDGCTVYRVTGDDYPVYFTRCPDAATSTQSESEDTTTTTDGNGNTTQYTTTALHHVDTR